jgi:hypothetical protein
MNHTTTDPDLAESDPYTIFRQRIALCGRVGRIRLGPP